MNEGLQPEPHSQGIIDAMQMPFAGTDHPVSESASANRNAGPLECLSHAVERCAIDVFVDECEGQRRDGGDTARQWLRRHRCDHDRRVDASTVTMAASILEPHILQDLCLDLDMELLGNGLAHAMHLAIATRASFLIVGKVVFDTLAGQVFWQRSAAPLFTRGVIDRRQACIREIGDVVAMIRILFCGLFGFVEEAIDVLFAAGCKPMQPCERQFFFQLDDPP